MSNVELKQVRCSRGFTIVEVAVAMVLLGLLLSSTLILINRYIDTVIDLRLREQAFDIARSSMEQLLSEDSLSEQNDYGTDEFNPDLDWEILVEPFYEPVTNRMWIRAICSSGFTDTKGERQDVELEHWITNLTADQIKKILAQQKIEDEYLELVQGGELTDIQKTTAAFLIQENMDVAAYQKFLKKQRRQKLEYLKQNGAEGYESFLAELEDEENRFLQNLGFDFPRYNEFAAGFDPSTFDPAAFMDQPDTTDQTAQNEQQTDTADAANSDQAAKEFNPADLPEEIKSMLPKDFLN